MNKTREFLLPFGIDLRVDDGIASIESDLPEALPSFSDPVENGRIVGVVEGVEQLLLSLARVVSIYPIRSSHRQSTTA
ncbi:hypothetical protein BZM27_46685 [Paraburkholderia steynii]|uniref:Uncharacterized protein n=1 Tax=Paraburkholderia steynii TaxID=1245441 RepID=A0A4V2NG53_9BURK|nr:hypothetical protein BZM27_46685 [Paraburkholderia steynii]